MRLGWYSDLNPVERRTYWACFGGYALDSMDTTIYALVIPALIATIGLTRPDAGFIATLSLIGAAVGGWGGGIAADRIGRVRVLQITILWVALTTAAAAFANGASMLGAIRFLQGIGYGGEAAVGGVLISEVVSPALRGRVASSVQSAYAVGYAVSVGLLPVITSLFPEAFGWRVFFGIGITPAVMVLFISKLVPESAVYTESRARGGARAGFWMIFGRAHLRRTVTAAVMSTGIFAGAYVMITWLPTYLRTVLKMSVAGSSGYLAANILGSLVGPLAFGWCADRIGRRYTFMLFLALQACNAATFLLVPIGPTVTVGLAFLLGAFQGGLASGMLPTFAELFPTEIRASGQGFTLSGGRGFGSVGPWMVGILSVGMTLGSAMVICGLCAYAVAFVAAFLLPETTGSDLHHVTSEATP
jgi:MFS family permease